MSRNLPAPLARSPFSRRGGLLAQRNSLDPERASDLRIARRIAHAVSAVYFLVAFIVFRDVLFAIPSVLRGEAVIVGDELVPFFNPHSQLLDQAAGEFNELTNGYEFRVRYSFLTTWFRHY
jgi:hypothetical protein